MNDAVTVGQFQQGGGYQVHHSFGFLAGNDASCRQNVFVDCGIDVVAKAQDNGAVAKRRDGRRCAERRYQPVNAAASSASCGDNACGV